jgi:imidazolonepropionase
MIVIDNIGKLVTMERALQKRGRNLVFDDLSIVEDAAAVIKDQGRKSRIMWVGPRSELPAKFKKTKKINARGQIVMPGLIDSHTHLIFAGDRSREFEMRLAGSTYQEIAASGGGIVNTMDATRKASKADLLKISLKRADLFLKQGVTTFEVKTGYGLDYESELKCLSVIGDLKKKSNATVLSTFLGAHAVPPEFKGRKSEYVKTLAFEWLPRLKGKFDFVDIFVDAGYFERADGEILLSEAVKHGLRVKLHADELELTGGTDLAVRFKALSADHLLKIGEAEILKLAGSEVTATLLPTTAFFLKTEFAPARRLLDTGVRVALATDFNPGTSPTQDVSLVSILAALEMEMRTEEIVAGLTLNGAYALGLENKKGALLPGYDADLVMFQASSLAQLFYEFGHRQPSLKVFANGRFL